MKNFRCYAVILLLLGTISGCGSVMSSAGAGPIEEDPGERTFGQQMTDESIETKAKVNINAADDGYDTAHLSVVSFNGFLLLVGQVSSEELKTLATDVVRKIEDVRRIYNELEVGEATGARSHERHMDHDASEIKVTSQFRHPRASSKGSDRK